MKKQLYLIATLALVASCTGNEEEERPDALDTPVAATFSGQVSQANTRSTDDNGVWDEAHQEIGISLLQDNITRDEAYSNVKYTIDAQYLNQEKAALAPEDADKFYFQSTQEKATFVAYAPYTETLYADGLIEVKAADDGQVPDYIVAQTEDALSYKSPKASLQFEHTMAKVTIHVSLGEGVNSTLQSVALGNLTTDGTLNPATGQVTLGEEAASSTTVSFSEFNDTKTEAYLKDFILLPGQKGLTVTITDGNDNTYQSTLAQSLASGNAYTIKVKANKQSLEVSATVTNWDQQEETDEKAGMIKFGDTYDTNLVSLYDIVFSDGSFMHTTDDDGNFKESLNLTESQKTAVRGIVYWQGNPKTQGDNLLPDTYCHGLILALKDAEGDIWCMNTDQISEGDWFSDNFGKCYWIDYQYGTVQDELQKLRGYTNTAILRYYNTEVRNGDEDYIVLPVKSVDEYGESNRIANTSGWYVPSFKEIALFRLAGGVASWGGNNDQKNTNISKVLELLGEPIATALSERYWTSTRQGNSSKKSANYMGTSGIGYFAGDGSDKRCQIRAVCAF
jgi:hypothetical protein